MYHLGRSHISSNFFRSDCLRRYEMASIPFFSIASAIRKEGVYLAMGWLKTNLPIFLLYNYNDNNPTSPQDSGIAVVIFLAS